jgi:hypothetical protein
MITRTIIAVALALGTTGAFAATKHQPVPQPRGAYEQTNSYLYSDPDSNVRLNLERDPANDR